MLSIRRITSVKLNPGNPTSNWISLKFEDDNNEVCDLTLYFLKPSPLREALIEGIQTALLRAAFCEDSPTGAHEFDTVNFENRCVHCLETVSQ